MEEKIIMRYSIRINWYNKKPTYLELAEMYVNFFSQLAGFDHIFDEMVFFGNKLTYLDYKKNPMNENDLAELLLKHDKYYIKGGNPNLINLDIHYRGDYPIFNQFYTKKFKPKDKINIRLDTTLDESFLKFEFPQPFEKDLAWLIKILEISVKIFKPDFGSLFPNIISYFNPPRITGGWISYFSDNVIFPENFIDGLMCVEHNCIKLYLIENNHIFRNNEEQIEKLKNLVEKCRDLKLK